ncbi:hypothetical protein A2U01_0108476, partial [Trifolium medium]|nr:hypothetical protein [Trifolium medium]
MNPRWESLGARLARTGSPGLTRPRQ